MNESVLLQYLGQSHCQQDESTKPSHCSSNDKYIDQVIWCHTNISDKPYIQYKGNLVNAQTCVILYYIYKLIHIQHNTYKLITFNFFKK